MDVNRAQEILATDDKIIVKLDGVPVWIDSIDASQKTAKVHNETNPAEARTVNVQQLQEIH